MSASQDSRRFVLTGKDPEGHSRTIILWRRSNDVDGEVVCQVHITLDSTSVTETILTRNEAVDVAQAILEAAR